MGVAFIEKYDMVQQNPGDFSKSSIGLSSPSLIYERFQTASSGLLLPNPVAAIPARF